MILLNYAHPLTADQSAQVVALLGEAAEVRDVPTHVAACRWRRSPPRWPMRRDSARRSGRPRRC